MYSLSINWPAAADQMLLQLEIDWLWLSERRNALVVVLFLWEDILIEVKQAMLQQEEPQTRSAQVTADNWRTDKSPPLETTIMRREKSERLILYFIALHFTPDQSPLCLSDDQQQQWL